MLNLDDGTSRTCSRRSPTRSRASCRCSASSPARSPASRTCSTSAPTARSGWARCSRCRARSTTRPRSSRRARSAPSASSRTCTTGDLLVDSERDLVIAPVRLPSPVVSVAVEPSKKGEEDKLNQALRRLQEEDPDARRAPRRAHRRAAGRGPLADAHRGDGRPRQAPVRRRHDHAPAAGAVPRGDPQGGARATAGTRSRPAAAASSATATSRSSRCPATRATSSATRSSAA